MNFEYSEKEEIFRREVKDWLNETLPKSLSEKVKKYQRLTKEDYEIFMNNLTAKGWLAWHWPKEYGGTGWNAIEKHIFEEEIIKASAPRIVPFGVNMLGPVLIEFGSEEQKNYYLLIKTKMKFAAAIALVAAMFFVVVLCFYYMWPNLGDFQTT